MKILLRVLLLLLILAGCSKKEGQETERSSQQLNQTEESPKNKLREEKPSSLDEIQFEQDVTYGSNNDVIVSQIAGIAVDERNRVFIADAGQTTIHIFDPDGSYSTSLGREGQGPGEFTAIYQHSTSMDIHSSRLYVTDFLHGSVVFPHRANVFSLKDLSFSHTLNIIPKNKNEYKEELEGFYPKRIYPRNDRLFLVAYHRSSHEYRDAESFIRYAIHDSIGTIISSPILELKDLTYLTYTYPVGITHMHSFPFFGKSLLVVSNSDQLFATDSKEFRIEVYDRDGNYVRTIQHPFNNRVFNKSEVMNHYEKTNYMSQLDRYEGDDVALKMMHEAENLPETWPALNDLLIDDENRLWVSTIVDDFNIYEWWILKETGEFITKFEWPKDEPIEVVRNDHMYTRVTDEESGLQQVVKYRIGMD